MIAEKPRAMRDLRKVDRFMKYPLSTNSS